MENNYDALIIAAKSGDRIEIDASGDGISLAKLAATVLLSVAQQVKRDNKTLEEAVAGIVADAFMRSANSENIATVKEAGQ